MLDAKFIKQNTDDVKNYCRNRNYTWDFESFETIDEERKNIIVEVEALKAKRNSESQKIGEMMKAGQKDQANEQKEEVRIIGDKIAVLDEQLAKVEANFKQLLLTLPNMPASNCPVGKDESENPEVRRWGTPREFDFEFLPHWDLGTNLDIIDFERGVKLAHSRFSVLRGDGAKLVRALINFFADCHEESGACEHWLPALANKETLTGTGQLPKFEEDLFKTTEGLYLIPTAEVMLTNLHAGEVLEATDLPIKYFAYTPCFREEAGSAGRDTRGLIRAHQFDKVEMVRFSHPKNSAQELENMTNQAELILQKLELPYRVIALCTGDLGFSANFTYDVEVWLPSYNAYKEISSCSNCGDFQ
ncbi:MAG: serine--tRNA ligase, partial [Coriobacteriales bacterium]|nr:serine--tRNA ligase [Coriobacteriales bacterium]